MPQGEPGLDTGLQAPNLRARGRVEGDDILVRRAQEQSLADLQRRHFIGRLDRVARLAAQIAGVEMAWHLEIGDIAHVALIER